MWFLVPNSCPSPKILSRSFLLQPPIVNSSPLLCLKSLFPLGRWVVLASARLVCTFGGWYWTRRYPPPPTHTQNVHDAFISIRGISSGFFVHLVSCRLVQQEIWPLQSECTILVHMRDITIFLSPFPFSPTYCSYPLVLSLLSPLFLLQLALAKRRQSVVTLKNNDPHRDFLFFSCLEI